MSKVIKYVLLVVVIALVGYKSVYFKKLSTIGTEGTEKFDAVAFTNKLWNEKLPAKLDSAIELFNLIEAIRSNPSAAFQQYSNAIAIGNYRYSLVKFKGEVTGINEDDVVIQYNYTDSLSVLTKALPIATEFIYGNAIRDASGLVNVRDFTDATDLNRISEELNKKVKTIIIPPFRKQVKLGDTVAVTGAIKLNKAHIGFFDVEVLPLRIKVL
jgi:predicted lipoprotein